MINCKSGTRALLAAYCLVMLCALCACSFGRSGHRQVDKGVTDSPPSVTEAQTPEETGTPEQPEETETSGTPQKPEETGTSGTPQKPEETGMSGTPQKPEETGMSGTPEETEEEETPEEPTLSSVEELNFRAVDDRGKNYAFSYHGEEFSAKYSPDKWKIIDSYKIVNTADMKIICRALLDAHPVHGRDMQSIRTPEDMAFEWQQHNFAYDFLPEDSPWRLNAKDVDLDPADQGRTFMEMYEARTGKPFRLKDFLPSAR